MGPHEHCTRYDRGSGGSTHAGHTDNLDPLPISIGRASVQTAPRSSAALSSWACEIRPGIGSSMVRSSRSSTCAPLSKNNASCCCKKALCCEDVVAADDGYGGGVGQARHAEALAVGVRRHGDRRHDEAAVERQPRGREHHPGRVLHELVPVVDDVEQLGPEDAEAAREQHQGPDERRGALRRRPGATLLVLSRNADRADEADAVHPVELLPRHPRRREEGEGDHQPERVERELEVDPEEVVEEVAEAGGHVRGRCGVGLKGVWLGSGAAPVVALVGRGVRRPTALPPRQDVEHEHDEEDEAAEPDGETVGDVVHENGGRRFRLRDRRGGRHRLRSPTAARRGAGSGRSRCARRRRSRAPPRPRPRPFRAA